MQLLAGGRPLVSEATPTPAAPGQVREDAFEHRGLHEAGDDLELAAAKGAVLDVDQKKPREQPGLADANRLTDRARSPLHGGGHRHASLLIRQRRNHH